MPVDRRCLLGCPQGTTLHKFPDDEEIRKKWLNIIDMENCPKKNLFLCTRHFERRMKGKTRVVWNAVPTLHLQGINEENIEEDCEQIDEKKLSHSFKEEHDSDVETKELQSNPDDTRTERKTLTSPEVKVNNKKSTSTAKATAADLIKHKIKIVDGKVFKIQPMEETIVVSPNMQTKQKVLPSLKNVTSSERKNSTNSSHKFSPTPVEFEIIDDNLDSMEKDVDDIIMEEFLEDEGLHEETDSTNELCEENTRNAIIRALKGDADDSTEIQEISQEDEEMALPVEEHEIKFGFRCRPTPKERCGYVERFSNNNTFCLTCSFCQFEFELWDWQQFIDHFNEDHIPKVQKKRKPLHEPQQNEENLSLPPKVEQAENNDSDGDVEQDLELTSGEKVIKQNVENNVEYLDDSLTNEHDESQFYDDDDEDWQVDKLEEYEDIEIYEQDESDTDNNLVFDVEKPVVDKSNFVNDYGGDEDEEEMDDENDSENLSAAVINFKSTEQTRIMKFLKTLRTFPVLWYPRRYGPPVYDEELKKFLKQFDESMTTREFRSSVEHLRHQYKRFTPLTPRLRVKLQNDADLRECIQLIKEIADKLSKPYAFYCDVCSFCFLDEQRMKTHRFLRHKIGNLPYICSCGNRFEFERQKNEHENLHKLRPRFTCEICSSNFIFNRLLRDHMNEYHPETQDNPLPFACSKCGEKFPSIVKRASHMEKHAVPKYHCKICNQSYKTGFRYRHHLKRHQDQRDWVCEHCGKAFIEKRSLNAHLFRVHKDGGLKCMYCRTFFAGKESLDAHNRKFHPNGTNLDRMKNIRSYHNSNYKSRHLGEPAETSKRHWECKECGESFTKMWSLVAHKRQTGHNLQMYNCTHCNAVLSSGKTLKGHMRRVHKLPIATMADLRNILLPAVEESIKETVDVQETEENEGLKIEEIEIFEAYDVEGPQY